MKSLNHPRSAPPGGIKIHDVLYVLFKHKWKIILLSLIGFGAAGAFAYQRSLSPSYETKAKLLVRYVVERNTIDSEGPDGIGGGMAAINTELEILQSADLAIDTAAKLGPERLLPDHPVPPTAVEAAGRVMSGLTAEAGIGSNVIYLSYRDSDPVLLVDVLDELIHTYFTKHLKIHRSTGDFEDVAKQAAQAQDTLRITEEEITKLKSQSGVLSIESTISAFDSGRQVMQGALRAAKTSLVEQNAKVEAMEKVLAASPQEPKEDSPKVKDPAKAQKADLARRAMAQARAEYLDLTSRLELLNKEKNQMLLRRPTHDPMVVSLDRQISAAQRRSIDLTSQYPELAGSVAGAPAERGPSLEDERALKIAMEARVAEIGRQIESMQGEVPSLSGLESKLEGLERRRTMEDERYRLLQTRLEKARLDETLDASRMPNIVILQNPSAPVKSLDEKTKKVIMGIAGSGLIAGLALAFLLELVVDRRVSRPEDIQVRLQLPLMLSIPYIRSKDGMGKLIGRDTGLELLEGNEDLILPPVVGKPTKESPEEHFIAPYAGAIHDRIIFNFQINNITHKPKLVALTGLSDGAGVSTIAAGLAKAFAENGDRKVLLVDLTTSVRENPFLKHPADSLRRALDVSRSLQFRQNPRNLYYASAPMRREGNAAASLSPISLQEIMPHLVSSDYDYIVFDLPPIGPTSPALAVAGFMDKVLLVVDGECTTRENLNWAYSELERGRADVSCIFNKARTHAPRWVQGEV